MSRRIERVNALLAEEISDLLRREVHDPRVSAMVSVTSVDTSPDLRSAIILVSILGDEEQAKQTMDGLQHAAGYLRHEMSARLRMKYVPELTFRRDMSIQKGSRILEILKSIEGERDEHSDTPAKQ